MPRGWTSLRHQLPMHTTPAKRHNLSVPNRNWGYPIQFGGRCVLPRRLPCCTPATTLALIWDPPDAPSACSIFFVVKVVFS